MAQKHEEALVSTIAESFVCILQTGLGIAIRRCESQRHGREMHPCTLEDRKADGVRVSSACVRTKGRKRGVTLNPQVDVKHAWCFGTHRCLGSFLVVLFERKLRPSTDVAMEHKNTNGEIYCRQCTRTYSRNNGSRTIAAKWNSTHKENAVDTAKQQH